MTTTIQGSTEAESFVEVFQAESGARLVVAFRHRPRWATSRRIVYGEVAEVSRDNLAMTDDECEELLGKRMGSLTLRRELKAGLQL